MQSAAQARNAHVELLLCLRKALAIVSVDEVHNGVDLREIVLPHLARDFVTAQVEGTELNLCNRELLRGCARGIR